MLLELIILDSLDKLSILIITKTITIQEAQKCCGASLSKYKTSWKNCGMFGSFSANESFSSLKSGMFVEVKGYPKGEIFNAYRIKWQCNTAY